jgi:hypothetical protein
MNGSSKHYEGLFKLHKRKYGWRWEDTLTCSEAEAGGMADWSDLDFLTEDMNTD